MSFFRRKEKLEPKKETPPEGSFLTGDAVDDDRNVRLLLDAIAAVSETA